MDIAKKADVSKKRFDFSAKAVYFMRVLVGFIRPAGKNPA